MSGFCTVKHQVFWTMYHWWLPLRVQISWVGQRPPLSSCCAYHYSSVDCKLRCTVESSLLCLKLQALTQHISLVCLSHVHQLPTCMFAVLVSQGCVEAHSMGRAVSRVLVVVQVSFKHTPVVWVSCWVKTQAITVLYLSCLHMSARFQTGWCFSVLGRLSTHIH